MWPDAYYMSMNVFDSAGSAFLGPQPFAFNRTAMLAGTAATFVTTRAAAVFSPTNDAMLPADLDGSTQPTSGAPAPFLMSGTAATWKLWRYHVDFGTPANSTFTLGGNLTPAAYTELCPSTRSCVPQLGTSSGLDGIGDRGMFRLAYRKFADGHEALVGNQSVSSGGVAGIRWYEIGNATAGTPAFVQQSTYQPDSTWRWMGSAAMDRDGDLALGYSASNAAMYPQIRYAGRLAGDPTNTLAQGEATLFAGTGSQFGTGNRWGDYSDLTVDPVDDCTFWYTQEYYAVPDDEFNWRTRIGNFKFPSCNNPNAFLTIGKTADAATVDAGSQVGFTVTLSNVGGQAATGIAVTDTLPSGTDVSWSVDAGGSSAGWSVSGSPPNQQLVWNQTSLAAGASTHAHVVSSTTTGTCGAVLSNTASFTSANGGSNSASASVQVLGPLATTMSQNFDGVTAPALPAGWTATNATGGRAALDDVELRHSVACGGLGAERGLRERSRDGERQAARLADDRGSGCIAGPHVPTEPRPRKHLRRRRARDQHRRRPVPGHRRGGRELRRRRLQRHDQHHLLQPARGPGCLERLLGRLRHDDRQPAACRGGEQHRAALADGE